MWRRYSTKFYHAGPKCHLGYSNLIFFITRSRCITGVEWNGNKIMCKALTCGWGKHLEHLHSEKSVDSKASSPDLTMRGSWPSIGVQLRCGAMPALCTARNEAGSSCWTMTFFAMLDDAKQHADTDFVKTVFANVIYKRKWVYQFSRTRTCTLYTSITIMTFQYFNTVECSNI